MRRPRLLLAVSAALLLLGVACSDDDGDGGDGDSDATADVGESDAAAFCDVYLDYLADATQENLTAVESAGDDEQVSRYAEVLRSDDADITQVVAATLDLDDLARERCQPQWIGGAQGAGNTPAAAQAMLDAIVAGDPVGARNVASANAIAVFEPWEPRPVDAASGTPAVGDLGGEGFSLVLDPDTLAECQVETGVVVACQVVD